jgi:hypothetical protein
MARYEGLQAACSANLAVAIELKSEPALARRCEEQASCDIDQETQ